MQPLAWQLPSALSIPVGPGQRGKTLRNRAIMLQDTEMLEPHADGVVVSVRVVPGARATEIALASAGMLRIRVAAPAVEGKANEALLAFLANQLGVRTRDLALLSGERSRMKRVLVRGREAYEVATALGM